MKTLTTLTAAAALIAGFSVAGAQNATTPNQKAAPPSSINAGSNTPSSAKSGSQPAGTAQSGAARTINESALTVTGSSQFCIKTPTGNSLDCQYATMAACQEIAQPDNKVCMSNPRMGTTGAGTGAGMESGTSTDMQKK